jgi:hypothetical protein
MPLAFAALCGTLLSGCDTASTSDCDPGIVKAFRALPAVQGVEVDLHTSTEIGCTDTVTTSDQDAFVQHYKRAMLHAGWRVSTDLSGVFGLGPSGGVRVDRLEGDSVGVYALSLDEIQSQTED